MVYVVHLELDRPVAEGYEVRAGGSSVGKVDILLQKSEAGVRWNRVGKTLPGHGEHVKAKDFEVSVAGVSFVSSWFSSGPCSQKKSETLKPLPTIF